MSEQEEPKGGIHRYQIEEIFESYQEYSDYLIKALATFQDMKKSRNPTMRAFVPEYLEIDFANIKAPRIYYPRYKGTIVVQFPQNKLSPKQKGAIRAQKLIEFSPLVKINEVNIAEELAMRMKLLSTKREGRAASDSRGRSRGEQNDKG